MGLYYKTTDPDDVYRATLPDDPRYRRGCSGTYDKMERDWRSADLVRIADQGGMPSLSTSKPTFQPLQPLDVGWSLNVVHHTDSLSNL
jgi:hypothetical protein